MLRYELYQIEQYEQYMMLDLKRKRKKSSLQLWTPEGLDYIRIARLQNVVRFSSVTALGIFVLYPGVVVVSSAIAVTIVTTPSIQKDYAFYYWGSVSVTSVMFVLFLLSWLFFKCWVSRKKMRGGCVFVRVGCGFVGCGGG